MTLKQRALTLRGLKTAWLDGGPEGSATDPIVVLLHGFPDAPECWDHQIDALKDKYRVIAPYIRGAGPSEKSRSVHRYGPDSVGLDLLEILAAVDPDKERPIFIVGHDLGSVHAWHLAGLLQDRARGLVILNGLTIRQMVRRFTNPRQLKKSWYLSLMQVPMLPEVAIEKFAGRFLQSAHRMGGLRRENRPNENVVNGALSGPLNQYRAFLRAAPKAMLAPRRRLDCPVLAIFGADDAFLEPPTHVELSRDASRITVRILPGNHWIHRQDAPKFNKLLLDFIAEHAPEAPT